MLRLTNSYPVSFMNHKLYIYDFCFFFVIFTGAFYESSHIGDKRYLFCLSLLGRGDYDVSCDLFRYLIRPPIDFASSSFCRFHSYCKQA